MKRLWHRISYIGVEDQMKFDTKRRVILLNRIASTLFVVVLIQRIAVTALGFQAFTLLSVFSYVGIFSILLFLYFNKKGYYNFNAFVFSAVTPLCILFFSSFAQTVNDVVNINHYYVPRIFIMGALVLPLILVDSKNKRLMYLAIAINIGCIVMYDTVVDWVGVPFNPSEVDFSHQYMISRIMILPAFLLVMGFMFLTKLNREYEAQIMQLNQDLTDKNSVLEQINEEVVSQRDMISAKNIALNDANKSVALVNEKLTDSILYAERIQQAVLSSDQLPQGYFKESFVFFKPKAHVSGDLYFFREFQMNNEKCIVFSAIDCTGHGVPGGFLSMLALSLINEVLQKEQFTNAADVLNLLRDKMKATLNQTGELDEQKDGLEMAWCMYYPDSKRMDYAGARMSLCYVNNLSEFVEVKADRQPVGIHLKEKEFVNHSVHFQGGEMIYLFSDGLQDQFGGPEGKKLKFVSLKNHLTENAGLSAKLQNGQLDQFIKQWICFHEDQPYEQIDDMVLIGVRV